MIGERLDVLPDQCCQIRNVKVSYQNLKIIGFWEKLSYKNTKRIKYIYLQGCKIFYSQFKQAV